MLRCYNAVFVAFFVFVLAIGAGGQDKLDLGGTWQSAEGEVALAQNGSNLTATLKEAANCPFGGSRDPYLQGTLSGKSLHGTVLLCTHNKQLLEDCNLKDPYAATFDATVDQDGIHGTYRVDYVNFDQKDGHYTNCRITPAGGGTTKFDIFRADCCDEVKQLKAQVAALEQRLQKLEANAAKPTIGS